MVASKPEQMPRLLFFAGIVKVSGEITDNVKEAEMEEVFSTVSDFMEEHDMAKGKGGILAAVSGGADSVCMLLLLDRYCREHSIRLGVGHVNHGFRQEAAAEAEYVRTLCRERNIPFFLKEIRPGEIPSAEETARIYRYRLLEEMADDNGYEKIALAHNANDRAETLLFNMFRGTGLKGMGSIRPVRERFIRPILCLKRAEIEEYLNRENIPFCTDATNLEDNYTRNKIRHHILPLAEEINAGSTDHICEVAEYMTKLQTYIQRQTEDSYDRIASEEDREIRFDIKAYIGEDHLIRTEMIRLALTDITPHLKDITAQHISEIDKLAFREDNGQIHLPYGIKVYREYGYIVISKQNAIAEEDNFDKYEKEIDLKELLTDEVSIGLPDEKRLVFRKLDISDIDGNIEDSIPRNKYTKWFDCDKISSVLCVRNRREGDFIIIDGAGHKKSLSRLFIENKIPERRRKILPVIATEDDILWAAGCRDSFAYRLDGSTKTILEIKLEE